MDSIELTLSAPVDCIGDFTYNFYWQHKGSKLEPDSIIPHQEGTEYTYRNLVDELSKGTNVHIKGDCGKQLASSMGVDLYYFGGSGGSIEGTGNLFVDGNVKSESFGWGVAMCAGNVYVNGSVSEPWGNVVEVTSDVPGYRKFRAITEIIHNGLGDDELLAGNTFDGEHFILADGIIRNTIGTRCKKDVLIEVKSDVDLSTGILMRKGTIHVHGNAGMMTGVVLQGGTVIVDGNSGEFTGTEMKNGTIVIGGKIGSYTGSKMVGGIIYAKSGAKTTPPAEEQPLTSEDTKYLIKTLKINPMFASGYKRYTV
ncbi:hypothetical protein DRN70_02955 [Methanosarcinales archaeon]|nr:MAG: hypothetical protein DRN70_02955 [Methanosarcinales archaeon]